MPFVAARWSPLTDLAGERLPEFDRPLAHGLVAYANAARRKHLLDHAKTQRKPEIEPNRIAYDLRRKAMAAIKAVTGCRHARAHPVVHSKFVNLTVPPRGPSAAPGATDIALAPGSDSRRRIRIDRQRHKTSRHS